MADPLPAPPGDSNSRSTSKPHVRLAIALGAAALVASIALSMRPTVAIDTGLDFEPTAAQLSRIDQLRAQITKENPHFREGDIREKENAKLFTYMAATSEDPLVVEAALAATQAAYSSRSDKKETPDADLDRLLIRYLNSPSPQLAELAFESARIPIMTETPRPELIAALSEVVGSAAPLGRRYRALETLNLLRPSLRDEAARATFQRALDESEPLLVSLALYALAESAPALETADRSELIDIQQKVRTLLTHADPGVRGRALYCLTELQTRLEAETLESDALSLLLDPSGYVRGQALDTLARSQDPLIIPKLAPLIRDLDRAHYAISGWTDLRGAPGSLPHDIPGRRTVAEVALFAVLSTRARAVSAGTLPATPELPLIADGPVQTETTLRENAERVETWMAQVPQFSALAPAQHTQKSQAEPSPRLNPAE